MTTPVIIDAIAVAVLAGFAIVGVWKGLLRTLAGLLVLVLALAGAGIVALAALLITKLLGAHMGGAATVIVAALLGAVVYGAVLVMTKNIREYEISVLYGKQARKLLGRIIS